MTRLTISLIIIAGVISANLAIACDYPERVELPKGNTATGEEMLVGQSAVTEYVADMSVYLECIAVEEKNGAGVMQPDAEHDRKDKFDKKYDAAMKEMEKLAEQFNAEARKFRSKNSD
jgi:hypothetical protein